MTVKYKVWCSSRMDTIDVDLNVDYGEFYYDEKKQHWRASKFILDFPKTIGIVKLTPIDRYRFTIQKGNLFSWKLIIQNMENILRETYEFVEGDIDRGIVL